MYSYWTEPSVLYTEVPLSRRYHRNFQCVSTNVLLPPAVLSSLGSAATGQFGSLGVSWNSGAPPPSLRSHCPVPGGQSSTGVTAQRQRPMERKQTPDDDLGMRGY